VTGTRGDLIVGRMTRRAQSKITEKMDEGIAAVARELAGGDGDPRMMRSHAIRELIAEGLVARSRRLSRTDRFAE
jgi:hypothetical protein